MLLEKISENGNNINIIEEQIDVDVQMKYFELGKSIKKSLKEEDIEDYAVQLFDESTDEEEKKRILIMLAGIPHVKAFRQIEAFTEKVNGELTDWSRFALQQSKALIENDLLDKNSIFITSGLGGKNGKLRYFIALFADSKEIFKDFQHKIIKNETEGLFIENNIEIEEIQIINNFVRITALIPLQVLIPDLFRRLIDNMNEFGNFMSFNFLINNVKIMTPDEIHDFLEKEREKRKDEKNEDDPGLLN